MSSKKPSRAPDAARIFWHGTELRHAHSIMTQGFRIGELRHGRILGRGLYVTHRAESAASFGRGVVIRCRLASGTKILWCDVPYDPRVIDSLKREFGNELLTLGPDFSKALPQNKSLTKQELVNLCSWFFAKRTKLFPDPWCSKRIRRYKEWWWRLSRLTSQMRRHGYDGIGRHFDFRHWDSDEILLFNPSRASPLSAHQCGILRWDAIGDPTVRVSGPIPLGELKVLSEKDQAEWAECEVD